jgi:RND superfamily putative drug exporter
LEDGAPAGLLGFRSNVGIVTWLPLFLFTVLFGLSRDYHVFIVSRIKELVKGIRTTASTVTSAASMKLLGRWNWYLPGGLRWLPRVRHGVPASELG